MYTIIFKIEGKGDVKLPAVPGTNVMELARNNNIEIDAPCNGNGTCGKCRVRIISGSCETIKSPRLGQEDFDDGWRLACQSTVNSDAIFWVPATAAAFKSDIQTADLSSEEELHKYENAVENIFAAGISRGVQETGYGVAVDIGTTTVTAAMLDLASGKVVAKASLGNGQIKYGADVINRIIQQSKPGGVEKLQQAVREDTVVPIMNTMIANAGITADDITRIVIAGNTTMEHLFVGANGESIRLEPYEPEFLELHGKTAAECGLPAKADAPVIFAPNVGSWVGGDITAGTLDTLLWNKDAMGLFIALGTNGELVFGNSEYMLTCACSAGPAFEGGDISCGMRATTGAVDSIAIDEATMEPTLTIIGEEGSKVAGLCGSGLIDTIAELFRCGIIDARGKFVREGRRVKVGEYQSSYVLAFADESATGRDVDLTEGDIDNFIRAKAAIFSAVQTMLKSVDMTIDDIDSVMIAGGIGSGINMENAMRIGMLPKQPIEKYSYIGNSSLTGACAMLLSDEATDKVFELASCTTYLELSTEPGYMDEFVAACFIPHTDSRLFE
ncbi:MAG: ASKHA domain-containing protein [Oscillospiraceae bacterium]|nr:ASKHA domain-containing protein [Oscillospiraceae bacterium]